MKTAKLPPASAAEPSSSRRSQPVRQTRTNPSRNGGGIGRAPVSKDRASGAVAPEQPIEIFPAILHFTDTITDLPQALARHFTLLKEVDAKVHAPEQALFELIEEVISLPVLEPAQSRGDGASSLPPGSAPMSAQNSSNGLPQTALVFPANNPDRRHAVFRGIAARIAEMLVSLEEKNHVITTANNELAKRQDRINGLWGHLVQEFSEEARFGSSTHWAYAENRAGRSNNTPADRPRRDGAPVPPAPPPAAVEEAASRSDARKQAVAARKEKANKAQPTHESDMDDHDAKQQKAETGKKTQPAAKSRKPAAQAASEAATPVGLGITAPSPVNGNPAPKRRKVEKPTNGTGSAPMERAMSSVFGNNVPKQKTASPRETPAPENQSKKRKALPSSGNQAKKSRNGTANSPSIASSPVIGTFPEAAKPVRNSPVPIPIPGARIATATRVKPPTPAQQPVVENGRPRPSSIPTNKVNGVVALPPGAEVPVQINGTRATAAAGEAKATKEVPVPKPEVLKPEVVLESTTAIPPPIIPPLHRRDPPSLVAKREGSTDSRKESPPVSLSASSGTTVSLGSTATTTSTITTTSVTTKSGRASKPSTPALGSFPENARARPPRAAEGGPNPTPAKRSHKKGASIALANNAALASELAAPENGPGGGGGGSAAAAAGGSGGSGPAPSNGSNGGAAGSKKGTNAGDEALYCYCMRVSYGAMIACDAEGCPREWFHYDCVGLKSAPKNALWYCKECKKRLNIPEKKSNGT